MRAHICLAVLAGGFLIAGCGGGDSGQGGGDFSLIEFLESGQDSIPRNRTLTFRFSAPVGVLQDFFERLKIENVQTGPGQSNFARAIGTYVIDADRVTFTPRLPTKQDRSDAGFKEDGNYVVFLKAGPDALSSNSGSPLSTQQQFIFGTSTFFEDPIPAQPPRALGFFARTPTQNIDLSRLEPTAGAVSSQDNSELIAGGRVIEPGSEGAPYDAPWSFELVISEPLDPRTVSDLNVQLTEIHSDATTTSDTDPTVAAPPGYFGTAVNFPVPVELKLIQGVNEEGVVETVLRVNVLGVLVDDTRYRIAFSGNILGIDFRKQFIGENGLTGDGQTIAEPGGFGYTSEFIVRDRPSVLSKFVLTYDPLVDGVQPETGKTSLDEDFFNTSLYNPPSDPGQAVGFVGAFGSGSDGPLVVSSGTLTIDTGDTPNEVSEVLTTVTDLDPTDSYKNTPGLPAPGTKTYTSVVPTVFDYESITVAAGATLKIIGVNPVQLLSSGIVQIDGIIDAAGGPGQSGNISGTRGRDAAAGAAGPGGFQGGFSKRGNGLSSGYNWPTCSNWQRFVTADGASKSPYSLRGDGPGRGYAGGEHQHVYNQDSLTIGTPSGTGGGGGSHGGLGVFGEDRNNGQVGGLVGSPIGSPGKCSRWGIAKSGLIGLRGSPGPLYGDREALDFLGGSGGGAGGSMHKWNTTSTNLPAGSGGAGGGGGGFLEILSSGPIFVKGVVDVSGGQGGLGHTLRSTVVTSWTVGSGSGAGGSGGTISLISGNLIDLNGGMLDARGGLGGPRPTLTGSSCQGCNGGGDGGKGFIHLMDADGVIQGITPGNQNPGEPGNFDEFDDGVLSIRGFDVNRFGGAHAITELYSVRAANPSYLPLTPPDIVATVTGGQVIEIRVSSARPDPVGMVDLLSETFRFKMAEVSVVAGGTVVDVTGDMSDLNPLGVPARDAFIRWVATFLYDVPAEAALGPFMKIDEVTATFTFN